MWVPIRDTSGRQFWCNDCNGAILYVNPHNPAWRPQAEPIVEPRHVFLNGALVPFFTPDTAPAAAPFVHQLEPPRPEAAVWKYAVDKNTHHTYCYNTNTGETRWVKPQQEAMLPLPPPRSPRPARGAERDPAQWIVARDTNGNHFFYNKITRESQYGRPDCL